MATEIGGRRWLPSRRVLVIAAVVLPVVAGVAWLAKPVWQPWWYAATLCGGNLSGGDLDQLLPNERLRSGKDTFGSGHGPLICGMNENEGRKFVLKIMAETDSGDPGGHLAMEFQIPKDPEYVYPKSVPGFYGMFGPVIVQECPKLGLDPEGRKRRLVTSVYAHGVESKPSPQSLRTAVRIANGANAELGCGAGTLPLPDRVEPARRLSLSQTEGTMCGWLARSTLPRSPSGKAWQVVSPTDERAPITSCSLIDSGTGESAVKLTGWYGDWTDKPFDRMFVDAVRVPKGHSHRVALLGENYGRAKARCAGESANFLAKSVPRDGSRSVLPMSEVRNLLNAFATDQAKRRGCTGVELPGPTVHPDAS